MIHISSKTTVTNFLVFCAVAIAAMPALAQGVAFQSSSLPVQVRGEGLTETVGAVVLQVPSAGTIPSGSSIQIVYSGTITNASAFTVQNGLACVLGGIPCAPVPFFMATSASGSQLTITFSTAVPFGPGDYIAVSQVRMNINALGPTATTVTATLSGTSSNPTNNPITFTQSSVPVASIVNPSVRGTIASTATAIQTCSVPAEETFRVKATETFPAALTSLADEQSFTPISAINSGSLVNMVISNVPSGFAVMAESYTATSGGTITGGSGALGTEAGIGSTYPNTYTVTLSPSTSAYQVSTGSALTYTFFVTGDSTAAIESFTIQFGIGLPNGPNTGLSPVSGSIPAIGTTLAVTAAVSLGPSSNVVSFTTNNEGGGTVVTIGDCVTNLAFPYVSNQNGYDTSFSFANTTLDSLSFGAGKGASQHLQSGTCTVSLWPTIDTTLASSSPLGTPSQFTTPVIPAGGLYAFALFDDCALGANRVLDCGLPLPQRSRLCFLDQRLRPTHRSDALARLSRFDSAQPDCRPEQPERGERGPLTKEPGEVASQEAAIHTGETL